jgi:hypothetical protein
MAYTPCDVDKKAYTGRGVSIYPAILHGMDELRKKRKICPEHWAGLQDRTGVYLAPIVDGEDFPFSNTNVCTRCQQAHEADGLAGVFLTVYVANAERQDFFGRVCGHCYDDVASDLLLTAS